MSFARPELLLVLIVLAPLAFLWARSAIRRRRTSRALSRSANPRVHGLAGVLALAALALLVFAAAGPRWGEVEVDTPREGVDVLFVIDVSRSMDARDINPNRITATREAITASLAGLGGDRVGLVIFGGTAHVRFPLTTDLAAAASVVLTLESGSLFVDPGSVIAAGLQTGLEVFEEEVEQGRVVVLVSDGDDLGADPVELAAALDAAGIELLVVGVGTPEGATIPVYDRRVSETVELTDANGQPIISRLEEARLIELARAADGRYIGNDLAALPGALNGTVASLQQARIDERQTSIPVERFPLFGAAACVFLVLALLAERGLTLRRQPVVIGALAAVALLGVSCESDAYSANERGLAAYEETDYPTALEHFREAVSAAPVDFQATMNLAATYHALGQHSDAAATARRATGSSFSETRAEAQSTVGHALFAQGDLQGALEAFREALLEDPQPAYRHNYEVIYALLNPPPEPEPEPEPEPTPDPSETPGNGEEPTPPPGSNGEPSPTPDPGPGEEPGDENGDGEPGEPGDNGEPGSQGPASPAQLEDAIELIDGQINALAAEDEGQISPARAQELRELLAERARLAALRESLGGTPSPDDY